MLFGALLELHSGSGTIVFIIVLIFLLVLEAGLHSLETYCVKNGFKGLIQKLIREFMMMGLLSFGTYVAIEAYAFSKHNEWLLAFDFAHMVVLFVAISFVCQAVCFVILVNSRSKVLLKYSASSCEQLMSEYKDLEESASWQCWWYHYGPLLIPFPEIRSNIEYKIIEAFFIRSFNLPPEFNFAIYMTRTLKSYVISLVEVRPINWLILSCLVAGNYARLAVLKDSVHGGFCDHKVLAEKHEVSHGQLISPLAAEATTVGYDSNRSSCIEFLLDYIFFSAMMIVLYDIILLLISEVYMLRLMGKVTDAEREVDRRESKEKAVSPDVQAQMHTLFADWNYFEEADVPTLALPSSNSSNRGVVVDPAISSTTDADADADADAGGGGDADADADASAGGGGGGGGGAPSAKAESPAVSADIIAAARRPSAAGISLANLAINVDPSMNSRRRHQHQHQGLDLDHQGTGHGEGEGEGEGDGGEDDANHSSDEEIAAMEDGLQSYLQMLKRHKHASRGDPMTKPPAPSRNPWARFNLSAIGKRHMYYQCLVRVWRLELANGTDAVNRASIVVDPVTGATLPTPARGRANSSASVRARSNSVGSVNADYLLLQAKDIAQTNRDSIQQHDPHAGRRKRSGSIFFEEQSATMRSSMSSASLSAGEPPPPSSERWMRILKACSVFMRHTFKRLVRFLMDHHGDPPRRKKIADQSILDKQRDIESIFFLGRPLAYYHAVEFSMLLQCVYIAVWASNFSKIASQSKHSVEWQIALAIPVVLNFFLIRQILFFACMLKSVSALDTKIAEDIIELAMDERIVTHRLRKTIRTKLHSIDLMKGQWSNFLALQFATFTEEREGMDARTFEVFLHSLQIFLTKKSVHMIFKVIDFDMDGLVTWSDMSSVVFPEMSRRHVKSERKSAIGMNKQEHAKVLARLSTIGTDATTGIAASAAQAIAELAQERGRLGASSMNLFDEGAASDGNEDEDDEAESSSSSSSSDEENEEEGDGEEGEGKGDDEGDGSELRTSHGIHRTYSSISNHDRSRSTTLHRFDSRLNNQSKAHPSPTPSFKSSGSSRSLGASSLSFRRSVSKGDLQVQDTPSPHPPPPPSRPLSSALSHSSDSAAAVDNTVTVTATVTTETEHHTDAMVADESEKKESSVKVFVDI